jgi:hypothetical protein
MGFAGHGGQCGGGVVEVGFDVSSAAGVVV